mgnify:CR=1 FL=1
MFAYIFANEGRKGNGLVDEERNSRLVNLTADIVVAHVANHSIAVSDVPIMIHVVHSALSSLGQAAAAAETPEPAVPVRSSIKPDYIVCLEDGRKLKTLKRHLMAHYGMTPADYRAKWGLPANYPMVAPRYAEARRSIAKAVGLGRRSAAAAASIPASAGKKAPANAPATKPAANASAGKSPARARGSTTAGRGKRNAAATQE